MFYFAFKACVIVLVTDYRPVDFFMADDITYVIGGDLPGNNLLLVIYNIYIYIYIIYIYIYIYQ